MRYVCVSAHTACVMRHVCHATLTMPPATPLSSTASNQEPRTGCIAQACSLACLQGRKCTSFGAGIFVATMSTSDTDVLVCWRRREDACGLMAPQADCNSACGGARLLYFGNRGCVTDVTEMRCAERPEKVNSLGAPRPRAKCAAARGLETTRPRDLHRARDPGCGATAVEDDLAYL